MFFAGMNLSMIAFFAGIVSIVQGMYVGVVPLIAGASMFGLMAIHYQKQQPTHHPKKKKGLSSKADICGDILDCGSDLDCKGCD